MKTKPWPIIILAFLHIMAPVGNFFFNSWRSKFSLLQQWQYWFEVYPRPLILTGIIAPILAGIFIYICKRWSYYAYLLCVLVIFSLNFHAYTTRMNYSALLALILVTLLDLFAVAYFVVPSVKKIYLDPRMRWWEAAPRYHIDIQGVLAGNPARFKNLSEGGVLAAETPHLMDNTEVTLSWEGSPDMRAQVVYQGIIHGQESIGLKFVHSNQTEFFIKQLIKKLHSEGKIVKERLPGPEDGFKAWLKNLFKKGEGLFPGF